MGAVWLVGESNPYSSDPWFDLYPEPRTSAGGRLCAFIGEGEDAYLKSFKRRNLLRTDKWSAKAADEAAAKLAEEMNVEDGAILLGAKVAWAFGFGFRSHLWRVFDGALGPSHLAVVPHPSGRSREWNDPDAPKRLREVVARMRALVAAE